MKKMKKAPKIILGVVIALIALFAVLLIFLSVTEYRPADREAVEFTSGSRTIDGGEELTVVSWNIGYSGLGKEEEFFMDGGKLGHPDKSGVQGYLEGIKDTLYENRADIYFLQEVDANSQRSYGIDQRAQISQKLGLSYSYARNFKCIFVPLPLPVVGKVDSGLVTLHDFAMTDAERIQLPVPFSWPLRTANLKRCLLVERLPIEGTDNQLVLVNLHMEAYDDGEGKAAQTKMLTDFVIAEYEKGNYVIAGGDWNQTFPGADPEIAAIKDENTWLPGELEADMLPEGWRFAADTQAGSCRLLNMPYEGNEQNSQLYIIDGFILSPNVDLQSVKTLDYGFENSDHQPVEMKVVVGTAPAVGEAAE